MPCGAAKAAALKKGRPLKPPHPSNRIGGRLRTRRLDLGLTIVTVSKQAGMTFGRLAGYELGSLIPGPGPLSRLAEALGLEFNMLWRLRKSSLVAKEFDKGIRELQIRRRAAIALVERLPDDAGDIRIRRPLPVEQV